MKYALLLLLTISISYASDYSLKLASAKAYLNNPGSNNHKLADLKKSKFSNKQYIQMLNSSDYSVGLFLLDLNKPKNITSKLIKNYDPSKHDWKYVAILKSLSIGENLDDLNSFYKKLLKNKKDTALTAVVLDNLGSLGTQLSEKSIKSLLTHKVLRVQLLGIDYLKNRIQAKKIKKHELMLLSEKFKNESEEVRMKVMIAFAYLDKDRFKSFVHIKVQCQKDSSKRIQKYCHEFWGKK